MSRDVAPPLSELVMQADAVPVVAPADLAPFMEQVWTDDGTLAGWRIRMDRMLGPTMLRKVVDRSKEWRATFERTIPVGHLFRVQQLGATCRQLIGDDALLAGLADDVDFQLWDGDAAATLRFHLDDVKAALRAAEDDQVGVGIGARDTTTGRLALAALVMPEQPMTVLQSDRVGVTLYADTGLTVNEWDVARVDEVVGWHPEPDDEWGRVCLAAIDGDHVLEETASDHFMALTPASPSVTVQRLAPVQVFSKVIAAFADATEWVAEHGGTLRVRSIPGRILD